MSHTRRGFLLWLGRGTAAGVALLGGAFGLGFFAHGHGRGVRTRRYLGRQTELQARLLASREGFWIDQGNGVLLLRDPDGPAGLRAISLSCTHLGCTLRPAAGNRTLECPCHGSAFSLLGEDGAGAELGRLLQGPATRDLDPLEVVLVGEHLFLEA
jgi:nitrite reductase/ring-hydroxylating ferredoxin subunit